MATAASTLVQRTRRFLGDWPENDALTASTTSSSTTLTVADATIYSAGWLIQVDTESMQVRSGSGTTVTVLRGARGSTAASHASGATVLIRPRFLDVDVLDALNAAIDATFPWLYQPVVDESITTSSGTYEYDVPNLNSVPIPYLSELQFQESGDVAFRPFKSWTVLRGSTPKIRLRRDLPEGTLRIYGFGPLPRLASLSDSLNALFPTVAEDALVYYAAQHLLTSGEARRVREDTGARDARENANRTGSSMNAANSLYQRFQLRLRDAGMPPMPKNVVAVV